MTPRPPAERHITQALVRRLLAEQHPDLAERPLGAFVEGWDCVSVPLGPGTDFPVTPGLSGVSPTGTSPALAVRIPRRADTACSIAHEQRWLPTLAARLAVPVPVPVRVGTPSDTFPWPWSVVPWFAGVAASTTTPAHRRTWARALAGFLADLHQPAPADAPLNPYRGGPLSARDAVVRPRLASFEASDRLLAVWESALEASPWDGPPVWLHGDSHPANVIVRDGSLAAVIDFIDLTSGDPATDLATAWLTFDTEGRADFRASLDARCGHRAQTWARARGWALALASAIADDVDPAMTAIAAHALRHVVLD